MATFLFDRVVFGPVSSRRLGVSLGINLLPTGSKWCTFNCIYCECGWTRPGPYSREGFPPRDLVRNELEKKLTSMSERGEKPDTITFAGNGEPTLHPAFSEIIDDTLVLRDRIAPDARVAVLSNGTMLENPSVFNALEKVDQNILKIDSAREETFRMLNQPPEGFTLRRLIENISRYRGEFVLQTLFVRGSFRGKKVDNASNGEVQEWLGLVDRLRPEMVMIYTIARDTPSQGLHKVGAGELENIASRVRELGIPLQVSG
jgi:wyosine [tRNA(Phe)-imidazoG37] synthetase (radical SAM superfamily)